MYFINCSNHPFATWGEGQKNAARAYGELRDIPFPPVDPHMEKDEISELADQTVSRIMDLGPSAVMCQGEFTLSYAIVSRLKERGVMVLSACSERCVEEYNEGGVSVRKSVFQFVKFREYG